jgi:hypothetical protein
MSEEQMPDELTLLQERAKKMGIKFHPNISLEKLKEKVASKMEGKPDEEEETKTVQVTPTPTVQVVKPTKAQLRAAKFKEANKLVRVNITCMNGHKKDWQGEVFTASNSVIGSIKKYVPFNVDWHVPTIILNMIKERKYQTFYTVKDSRGNSIRKGKLVPEFAIRELDPLTEKELKELAQRQRMASGTAEALT